MEKEDLTIICLDSDDDDVIVVKEAIEVISSDDECSDGCHAVDPPTIRHSSDFKPKIESPSIRHSHQEIQSQTVELQRNQKRLSNDGVEDTKKEVKRLKPTTISTCLSSESEINAEGLENGLLTPIREPPPYYDDENGIDDKQQLPSTNIVEKPITASYAKFIDACREADPTDDMEGVINNKLLKYYNMADSDLRNSESFEKTVISMTMAIQSNKKEVYLRVLKVLEELDLIQNKIVQTDVTYQGAVSADDERKENQLKLIYDTFNELQKKIYELGATEVDLINDENHSSEMRSLYVSHKKEASELYKRICKITGGLVKKRIKFNGTKYPVFNKKLQRFVNRRNEFPDVADVIRIFKQFTKKYQLKLDEREIKRISQDAFISIGEALQKRRKKSLYQTISSYETENYPDDPAYTDPQLEAKLEHNRKHRSRISDVLNRYAVMQETCSKNKDDATATMRNSVHSDNDNEVIDKGGDNEITIIEISSDLEN